MFGFSKPKVSSNQITQTPPSIPSVSPELKFATTLQIERAFANRGLKKAKFEIDNPKKVIIVDAGKYKGEYTWGYACILSSYLDFQDTVGGQLHFSFPKSLTWASHCGIIKTREKFLQSPETRFLSLFRFKNAVSKEIIDSFNAFFLELSYKELRKEQRVEAKLDVGFSYKNSEEHGITQDISFSGISIITSKILLKNSNISIISIIPPDNSFRIQSDQVLAIAGLGSVKQVQQLNGNFKYGIVFTGFDPIQKTAYDNYVRKLLSVKEEKEKEEISSSLHELACLPDVSQDQNAKNENNSNNDHM